MTDSTTASLRLTVASYYTRAVASDFARKVAETFATRVLLIGVGLVSSVIVARSLGPEGRGLCAVAAAIGAIGVQLGNLGLHASNTYYVAKDRTLLPALIGNTLVTSAVIGGVGAALLWAIFAVAPALAPIHGVLLHLAIAWIPLGLAYLLLQNLLLGISEVRAFNKIELLTKILAVGLLGGVIGMGWITPAMVFAAGLVAIAVSVGWALWQLTPHLSRPPAPSFALFRDSIRYGLKAYAGGVFAFLVLRVDLVLVQCILGAEQAGYYSIATNMGDMLYMLPVVVGTLLFPKLSAMGDPYEKWRATKRIGMAVGALMLATCAIALVLAEPAIRILFGTAFLPAAPALLLLLPGLVCLSVSSVLSAYIASIDIPRVIVWIYVGSFVLNVLLNLLLLRRFGICAASVNSTIAYGFSHICLWVLVRGRMRPNAVMT